MKIDNIRLKKHLYDIVRSAHDLKMIVDQNTLLPDSIELKAAKYILIELAEAMSNTLQHILARQKGIAVSGYIDTIAKGYKEGIISEELFHKLKPFFDFRNSLVHRYWIIDDEKLIANIQSGKDDFNQFTEELEAYIKSIK
ncbi:MAG: DUF86 domain-containing protein [Deltaproteobacteria bacterium]|nr:DUF86 domain-containing protein [Deltaproteobacteria bacterium]MBW2014745.1 DUF86 domain-containing protein [Deltaproteobacteria bacterium]MBW2090259.1 DUF86 domain-containing protein [Deltaproteobacteria bacterium]